MSCHDVILFFLQKRNESLNVQNIFFTVKKEGKGERVHLRLTIGKVSPPASQAEQMGHIFLSIALAQDEQTVKHLVTLYLSLSFLGSGIFNGAI